LHGKGDAPAPSDNAVAVADGSDSGTAPIPPASPKSAQVTSAPTSGGDAPSTSNPSDSKGSSGGAGAGADQGAGNVNDAASDVSDNDDESDDEQGSPAAGPVGMTVPAQVDPAAKPQQLLANVQAAMSECEGLSRADQIKKLLEIRAYLAQIKELVLLMDDNLEGPALKKIEQEIAETEEALNKAGVDDASGDEDTCSVFSSASDNNFLDRIKLFVDEEPVTALDPNASSAPAAPKGITKKVNATISGSGEAERPTIVRAGRAATLSQDPINGVRTTALTASFAAGCVPIGFGAKDLIQLLRSKVAKGDRTKVMIRGIGLVSLGLVWEAANIWMLAEGMHRAPATAKPVAKS